MKCVRCGKPITDWEYVVMADVYETGRYWVRAKCGHLVPPSRWGELSQK